MRELLECAMPRCHKPRVKRYENGRVPSLRKWCYLHFNGELAYKRKAYTAKLAKEGK